jgi:hypothetical protein
MNGEYKRCYKPIEYTFHLMKYHYWPGMEIKTRKLKKIKHETNESENIINKYSSTFYRTLKEEEYDDVDAITCVEYCGYKADETLLGPGVRYFVDSSRKVDIHMGNFAGEFLSGEGTVFEDNKMIYDGGISKGKKNGFGLERFMLNIEDHSGDSSEMKYGSQAYLEYKGFFKKDIREGVGSLHFFGNFNKFKKHFEEEDELQQRHLGIMESDEEHPQDIPLMTSKIDPGFSLNSLFNKISPGLIINSERKITHYQRVSGISKTFEGTLFLKLILT